jgi:hypothetical protein
MAAPPPLWPVFFLCILPIAIAASQLVQWWDAAHHFNYWWFFVVARLIELAICNFFHGTFEATITTTGVLEKSFDAFMDFATSPVGPGCFILLGVSIWSKGAFPMAIFMLPFEVYKNYKDPLVAAAAAEAAKEAENERLAELEQLKLAFAPVMAEAAKKAREWEKMKETVAMCATMSVANALILQAAAAARGRGRPPEGRRGRVVGASRAAEALEARTRYKKIALTSTVGNEERAAQRPAAGPHWLVRMSGGRTETVAAGAIRRPDDYGVAMTRPKTRKT